MHRPWRLGSWTLPRHHQCKSNFVRKSRNSEGGLINFQKNWAKIVGPRDASRVSRSTSSSKTPKPSNSSVKPGEKTFFRRKRFSKNSYGSTNGKQEQTRTKYKRKYKTFLHVRQRNAKREETRNKVHHCSSRKTRAAVRKQLRQTKSEVLTPIRKSRLGNPFRLSKRRSATRKIQTPRQTRVGSRSPGCQKSSLIPRGATLFANRYPNVSVNVWEIVKIFKFCLKK